MVNKIPKCVPAKDYIVLNCNEEQIFNLLRECCQEQNLNVTLRVAGGWMRDKLLGLECHDFDIAIDRMMGRQFAERLRGWLLQKGIPSSSYGVIQANPERSKHLETATLNIYGYPIDFVNLRSESYTKDSRIPQMEIGTPLEDALRRDITINSLFYNLQSDQVEDYCGTALEDLENRRIRTPLRPKETLMDDPLRLLRVVRFATRFQFSIDPELEAAIMDEEVDLAFRQKISRERVGIELDKILYDKNSLEGIKMLNRLEIFNLVFDLPPALDSKKYSCTLPTSEIINRILTSFERIFSSPLITGSTATFNKRLALLTAVLLPHRGIIIDKIGRKTGSEPLVYAIIRDSLKFTNQDMNDVIQLHSSIDAFLDYVKNKDYMSNPDSKEARICLGRILRGFGSHWLIGMYASVIDSIMRGSFECDNETLELFAGIVTKVHELGFTNAWSWRGILTGRDLQSLLQVKEGKVIGALLEVLIDLQYANPSIDKQAAADYITQYYNEHYTN